MHSRAFGRTGRNVSEIGLGTWQLGGQWGDPVPDDTALATLEAAADAGTTFFDTADVYGLGRSKSLIGRFLKQRAAQGRANELFVASKLGRFPEPGWPENFSLAAFRQHTEASLARLGVECLDLTQLHCVPMAELRRGDVFDWLRTLQSEGLIKQFGASVESMEEAQVCLAQPGLASLQIIFNIFRRKPCEVLFEEARRRGVAIIARLPLASGLLSGRFTRETQFAETDHRTFNRDGQQFNVGETFAGLPFSDGVELADALKPRVPASQTMAQMALRWCLDFSSVSVVIPGAKSASQARENALASELPPLDQELHEWLREFYAARVAARIRGPY